ncbi:ATP-binding protein [Streptomyces sp. NPDC051109]|uniref:ATP-binding protein n=1 Tax=Streptomyces sp. NPDC051109 TaxID=3365642 RepID=UPI00106633BF
MDTLSIAAPAARSAGAVAEAREAARGFLGALRPAVGPDAADSVVLVVSELVTNAVRHGGGTYTLRLTTHPDTIEVAVQDTSPELPRMRTPDLDDGTGGFGWHMINDVSLASDVRPGPEGGKTVRVLLPL